MEVILALLSSRPHLLGYARGNLARLREGCPAARVLLVDTAGAAPAVESGEEILPAAGLTPGPARQAALDYARRTPEAVLAFVDDDDWYGAGYLPEALAALALADVVGKRPGYVARPDGLWLVMPFHASGPVRWVTGGTLAFRAGAVPDFRALGSGEDVAFCADCRARGLSVRSTSVEHWVYRRDWGVGHGHAFGGDPVEEAAAVGYPATRVR